MLSKGRLTLDLQQGTSSQHLPQRFLELSIRSVHENGARIDPDAHGRGERSQKKGGKEDAASLL